MRNLAALMMPPQHVSFQINNALIQSFGVNNLNELTAITRSGTLIIVIPSALVVCNGWAGAGALR